MNESESQQPLELASPGTLTVIPQNNPKELMQRANDVANVCREIVLRTASHIQGKQFVRVEGWQAIATAHGCCLSAREVRRTDTGFVAVAECRRMSDGLVLATAEGFVGDDEKTWGKRDEYAKRAMCQTRAMSRVGRSAFAHVVVMIDSNLSTTPAEEVPENGFGDATPRPPLRQAPPIKAPVTASQVAKKAVPVPEKATEAHKKRAIELLEPARQHATQFFIETGKLLPNETLEDIPSDQWPKTKDEMGWLTEHIREFSETARLPEPPAKARGQKSEVRGEDDLPMGDEPKLPDSRPRVTGVLAHFTLKEGKKKDGTGWSLWGIKVDDAWYNTFSNTLGQLAQKLKGETVELIYEEGEKGNTALEIKPI